jgi:hypothetical protein
MSPARILSRSAHLGALGGVAIALALGIAGCTTQASAPSSTSTASAEVSPNGDIPDNQAFVAYTPASGIYTVTVPEGWAQSSSGGATIFTDKLNSARFEEAGSAAAPTPESATSTVVPQLAAQQPGFKLTDVTTVTRKGGAAVLIRYEQDAPKNQVTSTAGREAVEEYLFWKSGTLVTITLTSPTGADNVDPWRRVTDSFTWR